MENKDKTKCNELLNDKISDAIDVIVPTLLALLTAEMERTNDKEKSKENVIKLMAMMGLSEDITDFCKKYVYKEKEKRQGR